LCRNFSLLSFGDEAQQDEEEEVLQITTSKGKSSHDLLTNDPKLSSQQLDVVVSSDCIKETILPEEEAPSLNVDLVKAKLSSKSDKKKPPEQEEEDRYYLGKSDKEKEQEKLKAIKDEIKLLKKSMKVVPVPESAESAPAKEEEEKSSAAIASYISEQRHYKSLKTEKIPKKLEDREAQTLLLLAKFKNKIYLAKGDNNCDKGDNASVVESAERDKEEEEDPENPKSTKWYVVLSHFVVILLLLWTNCLPYSNISSLPLG